MKASATRPIWTSELLPAAMRGYDREKFLYYDLTTPTNKINVGAGGDATVTVDTTYQIEINDINAKDKLYMIWYPNDSDDYIELDSLTDFYYES